MTTTTRSDSIPKSEVQFSTHEYECSHGKAPRGRGYWAFTLHAAGRREEFWFNGSYGDAKFAAIAKAASLGYYDVLVRS